MMTRQTLTASCLCLAFLTPSVTAQNGPVPFEGTEGFQKLLHKMNFQPLRSIDEVRRHPPSDVAIIVFGDRSGLAQLALELGHPWQRSFVRRGGALLVASDHNSGRYLHQWGLLENGYAVYQPVGGYKGLPNCPIIQPTDPHPIFVGVKRLAANRPTFLNLEGRVPPGIRILGQFNQDCVAVLGSGRVSTVGHAPFMMGSSIAARSRVLLMGGHSVYMNAFLGQNDNDNFQFALNCARWFSHRAGGGDRKYCLLIVDGKVVDSFDVPITLPLNFPPLRIVNKALRNFELEGGFTKLVDHFHLRRHVLRGFLLLLTLALLSYAGWCLFSARNKPDRAAPKLRKHLRARGSEEPALVQRQETLAKSGNLFETARLVARHFFEHHLRLLPGDDSADNAFRRVLLSVPWWQRFSVKRDFHRLWRLAYGPPCTISRRRLKDAVHAASRLAATVEQDALRIPDRPALT